MSFYQSFKLLVKLRLTLLVVFSAGVAYFIALSEHSQAIDYTNLFLLLIGGFFFTSAANIFNEMIEVKQDKLMNRTKNRPLPAGEMTMGQALVIGLLFSIIAFILLLKINILVCLLTILSVLLYAFVYTPLKKIHPIAVFAGAFPGAFPVVIGYFSINQMPSISWMPLALFLVQFVWQFPHFWAIAWVSDEDYRRAGFRLLPHKEKNLGTAIWIFISSILLVAVAFLPYMKGLIGLAGLSILLAVSFFMLYVSIKLLISRDDKVAKKLMYASFLYLPLALLAFLL